MYALRGTVIHYQVETFFKTGRMIPTNAHPDHERLLLYGSPVVTIGSLDTTLCNFPGFWEKYGDRFVVEECEMEVVSHEYKFAGKLDLKGKYTGLKAIKDVKTANSYSEEKKEDYFTQMAGYDIATGGDAEIYVIIPIKSKNGCGYGAPITTTDTAKYRARFLKKLETFNQLLHEYRIKP